MGWLELLPLLKRMLPLLGRVAPMLETYIGARGATQGDAEALRLLSGDLKAHLTAAAQSHADVISALDAQNERVANLANEVERLRAANVKQLARLEQIDLHSATQFRVLRTISLLMVTLLLVCAGLLLALLLRR